MSPRRYGKSSLVNEAMKASGMKWFRINMELIADEVDLANYYVRNALSLSKFEKIKNYLKSLKIQLYKFGRHISLHKIPDAEFSDFVIRRFSSQKIDASE